MRDKLERGEYPNANRFWDDFKLVIKNCFTFNPPGAPVYKAGEQLQVWFDERWSQLPPLREVSDDDDESDDDSDSEQASEFHKHYIFSLYPLTHRSGYCYDGEPTGNAEKWNRRH